MKKIRVNDYDMTYLDIGQGPPLVCVHGSLNDFRAWFGVLSGLSASRRMIVPSLRHYFPERWSGQGGNFKMAQHVDDIIAFVEALSLGPIDLIGHSRGGHLAFRLASKRPDLLRKLVLAEPGGVLEDSLMPIGVQLDGPVAGSPAHVMNASEKIAAGDLDGGLRAFIDGINGTGTWDNLPATERQMREDNASTLIAQVNEGRQPFRKEEAEALSLPTLFVIGADTTGMLPIISRILAKLVPGAEMAIIPNAGHNMFRQQPKAFCAEVWPFLSETHP